MLASPSKKETPLAARNVRRALADAMAHLETADVPSAPLTAELLLMSVLGRDRAWLYAHPEYLLSPSEHTNYANLVERRRKGEPTQYLTGHQEFWGLEFEVTPAVLIPRPETEHIVEVALARSAAQFERSTSNRASYKPISWKEAPLQIADVGTGSGCIAVALAHELPQAQVVATDVSVAALEVARRNAERHGVADRVLFMHTNVLESFLTGPAVAANKFDLIVSNPPYVGLREAPQLQREVREHEPHEALFAGEDGLNFYPQLIAQAETLLDPRGSLIVELGHQAAEQVRQLLNASAWSNIAITNDLAGIPRVLAADRA